MAHSTFCISNELQFLWIGRWNVCHRVFVWKSTMKQEKLCTKLEFLFKREARQTSAPITLSKLIKFAFPEMLSKHKKFRTGPNTLKTMKLIINQTNNWFDNKKSHFESWYFLVNILIYHVNNIILFKYLPRLYNVFLCRRQKKFLLNIDAFLHIFLIVWRWDLLETIGSLTCGKRLRFKYEF